MKAMLYTSCVMDGFRELNKLHYKNHDWRMKALTGFLLILLILLLTPSTQAGEYGPTYTWTPSATNWTLNFSFTITTDFESNSTHVNFTNIEGWDQTKLLVGENGDLYTHSDHDHNITLTNLSNTYTRITLNLNGNTSINISDMLADTEYNILHDGVQNKTVTSDSNSYLFFYENFSGTVEINVSEFTGPPGITGYYNNYTADSSTDITVERLNGVKFEATANQTIDDWTCYNSTYVTGDGTDTGECEQYYSNEGDYTVKIQGTNTQGTTENATWSITVQDTTMSSVTNLQESSDTKTSITWSWSNPSVSDHNHTGIYLDGVFKTNVSNTTTSYTATGLSEATQYTISTLACDFYDNCAWNNETGTTEGNTAPTADFSYSIDDKTVDFTDTSTDSDGTISSWDWEFDDGGTSTNQNPSHTYSSYGTYNVRLTVTDNDGATDSRTKAVTLESPESEFGIIDYSPSFGTSGGGGAYHAPSNANATFDVITNKTSDSTKWYLNGTEVSETTGSTTSYYHNASLKPGIYEVSVVAQNGTNVTSMSWILSVGNTTFTNVSNYEGEVSQGFINTLGTSLIAVAFVFLGLGIMCFSGRLSAEMSLIVFFPTVWAFTSVNGLLPMWIRALFVIGVGIVWYIAVSRMVGER